MGPARHDAPGVYCIGRQMGPACCGKDIDLLLGLNEAFCAGPCHLQVQKGCAQEAAIAIRIDELAVNDRNMRRDGSDQHFLSPREGTQDRPVVYFVRGSDTRDAACPGQKTWRKGREGEAGRSRLKGQEIACLIHIPDLQDPGLDRRPEPVGKAVDLEPDVGGLGLPYEPGADQLVCVERPVKRRDEHLDGDGMSDDLADNCLHRTKFGLERML